MPYAILFYQLLIDFSFLILEFVTLKDFPAISISILLIVFYIMSLLENVCKNQNCSRTFQHPGVCNKKRKRCDFSEKCSLPSNHQGPCDEIYKVNTFWNNSPIYKKKILSSKIKNLEAQQVQLNSVNNRVLNNISVKKVQIDSLEVMKAVKISEIATLEDKKAEVVNEISDKTDEYEKLKFLINPTSHGKKLRERNPTNLSIINDGKSSTRFARRNETKHVLEYIHGGSQGSLYGAFDYLSKHATKEQWEHFVTSFKKGKFIEQLNGRFNDSFRKSSDGMNNAIASKYQLHLSRRRYTFLCKVQNSTFNSEENKWEKKSIVYGDKKINLRSFSISDNTIKNFVNGLDIGDIHSIPGYCGAFRTVTALTSMILDLHLRCDSLREKLIWFNDIENHFIIEFSDDGAPESKEESMCIGSLSMWNLGKRIHSRDYHYPLHTVTANEKDNEVALLWKQHTDEMLILEGNTLNICDQKVTVEFQPSADQSWQFWANNELTQSATYPSMYARVHKSQLSCINGSIGKNSLWKPPTTESRKSDLNKLNEFRETLPEGLSKNVFHEKELSYMAENGLRQLGEPRIGPYADLQRPEPLHLEINNWEHVLHLLYMTSIHKDKIDSFLDVLSSSISSGGCGLKFIASKIREHYQDTNKRTNKLGARLIGAQGIALAKYSFRLIDAMKDDDDTPAMKINLFAISKICQSLRMIGTIMNSVSCNLQKLKELKKNCRIFFNIFSLFFSDYCNSTVWTLGYVVPYHATLLWQNYKVGYGIISMQGKESKHAALKMNLKVSTNRSKSLDGNGKWHQIARSSFVRDFYLPFHFPIDSYSPHSTSRQPQVGCDANVCSCYRTIQMTESVCSECTDATLITQSAIDGKIVDELDKILKPFQCEKCEKRYPDITFTCSCSERLIIPKNLSVKELKEELSRRGISSVGSKAVLCDRLEQFLMF